jgi:hypothetical protein
LIPRKDRALKAMAYERTLSNVEYDRVSLSYNKNSLSGVVFQFCVDFSIFKKTTAAAELWPPGQTVPESYIHKSLANI